METVEHTATEEATEARVQELHILAAMIQEVERARAHRT